MNFTPDPFWNEIYNQEAFVYGKEPNEYLATQTKQFIKEGSKVLCIADGEGRNGVWLSKQNLNVVSFDPCEFAVNKAKLLAQEQETDIEFQVCDFDSFSWQPNSFDVIVGIFIQFGGAEMRQKIFRKAFDTLKSGGLFILQGYTPKQLEYKTGGPQTLDPCYTEEMIRDLAKEFEILDLCCYDKVLNEGFKHNGMSALLGLTCRK